MRKSELIIPLPRRPCACVCETDERVRLCVCSHILDAYNERIDARATTSSVVAHQPDNDDSTTDNDAHDTTATIQARSNDELRRVRVAIVIRLLAGACMHATWFLRDVPHR